MKTVLTFTLLLASGCGVEKNYPTSCPDSEWLIGSPGTPFAFCIQKEAQTALSFSKAQLYCGMGDKSVCSSEQWTRACIQNKSVMLRGGYEWVGGSEFPAVAQADQYPISEPSCDRNEYGVFRGVYPFRCCTNED